MTLGLKEHFLDSLELYLVPIIFASNWFFELHVDLLADQLSVSLLGSGQLQPTRAQAGVLDQGSSLHGELEPLRVLFTLQSKPQAGSRC